MAGFTITGIDKLMRKLKEMEADAPQIAYDALDEVGVFLEGKIKKKLGPEGGERTGKIYATGKKGERYASHQASAPGQPPAIVSSKLRSSITYGVEKTADGAHMEIGPIGESSDTEKDYAEFLELGTSKMRPRPYLFNTVKENIGAVVVKVSNRLRNALGKYKK